MAPTSRGKDEKTGGKRTPRQAVGRKVRAERNAPEPLDNEGFRWSSEGVMSEMQELSRILYRHDWPSVERWADCLRRLAELSDDEICELERIASHEPRAAA